MTNNQTTYSAHGKFLITGEYAILAGVPGLAIPLRLGQQMSVAPREDATINWKSHNADGSIWFESTFSTNLEGVPKDCAVTTKLKQILKTGLSLSGNNHFDHGYDVITTLDFHRAFGMGTSSTLIAMVAAWLECDSYALQFACFGGSGYDIACATAHMPIIYTFDALKPNVNFVDFKPSFSDQLFFVYLNRKQNSRESIARFDKSLLTATVVEELSAMPEALLKSATNFEQFKSLLTRHESIIADLISLEPIQRSFPDFNGVLKSLGGWGGDFILAVGSDAPAYFKSHGYDVVLKWDELILQS